MGSETVKIPILFIIRRRSKYQSKFILDIEQWKSFLKSFFREMRKIVGRIEIKGSLFTSSVIR